MTLTLTDIRHADIGTTMKLYAHLTEKLDREVAERGAAALFGG